jgi:hypothetical protein
MFFPLIMMDWRLVFGERLDSVSQRMLYDEHVQILENFLQSLRFFETGVDYYKSAQFLLANVFSRYRGLELGHAMTWEILITSPTPMTEAEISNALSKRMPQAIAGSRWDQLARLIGAEEIYFCINRPGGLGVKLQGLDILDVVCRGDDPAFAHLQREIGSTHAWVREICLGLKGVLPMIKMAATIGDDSRMRAETGLHIQERVKEVFGAIDVAYFGKACEMFLDQVNSGHGGDGQSVRSHSGSQPHQRQRDNSNASGQSLAESVQEIWQTTSNEGAFSFSTQEWM